MACEKFNDRLVCLSFGGRRFHGDTKFPFADFLHNFLPGVGFDDDAVAHILIKYRGQRKVQFKIQG